MVTYKALLIANWSFQYPDDLEERYRWPPLKGPKNDIDLMFEALTDPDYGLFRAEDITCCRNYTRSELGEAIENFFKRTEVDDYVLVYFSGHGFRFNHKLQLVTGDTHKRSATTALSFDTLDDCVAAENRAEQYTLILDCCYAGAAEQPGTKGGSPDMLAEEVLPGRWALYSSDEYSTSRDAKEHDEPSPFTKALCDTLLDPGLSAGDDGLLTIDKVKKAMVSRLAAMPGSPPVPKLKSISAGAEPGIARRVRRAADAPSGIHELSHLGGDDELVEWQVEVADDTAEMLRHLSSLHDLTASLLHSPELQRRARGTQARETDLEERTVDVANYLARSLGRALLTGDRLDALRDAIEDEPTRLSRVQLAFGSTLPRSVELLPWEYLAYVSGGDGGQSTLAMDPRLTIERRAPRTALYPAPVDANATVPGVALIGRQDGDAPTKAEDALRKDLAALDIQVLPAAIGTRYDRTQFVDELPPVVLVLAGLRTVGRGPGGGAVQIGFGPPGDDWCSIEELGLFLRPRRRLEVTPYRAIIVESFALDPAHDSLRATIQLASYLAGLRLGNVAFISHPPGSSGCLAHPGHGEPRTFGGQVVRYLNEGHPLHRAVYAAKMRIRATAPAQGCERTFGVPGMYQLTFPTRGAETRGATGSQPREASLATPPRTPTPGATRDAGTDAHQASGPAPATPTSDLIDPPVRGAEESRS